MRIYITGICGFIASNLANKLYDEGYDVGGCDNLKFGFAKNLNPKIAWKNAGFEEVSGRELADYDVLIHMATANIIYAMDYPIETFKTNSLDSINLVKKFGGKIIYISTSSIYGNAEVIPTNEKCDESVVNAYDTSKLILEKYLELRGNYTCLRLSNTFGINQRSENPYCGVVSRMIDSAMADESIVIYGDGKQTRDLNYVGNVVSAIEHFIERSATDCSLNIASGIEIEVIELAKIISRALDKPLSVKYVAPRKIDGIKRRCLDISKANKVYGWFQKVPLEEGIKLTIQWMKDEAKIS
jgi:UDP-glucose 4-epimerase